MELFVLFGFLIAMGIAFRLFAGVLDRDRLEKYIRAKGGSLFDAHWSPFGTGWLGEKNARIYQVRYRDRYGDVREATVKTSMLSGVYFTEDRVIQSRKPEKPNADQLERENARLRQRIAELERRTEH